MAKLKRLSIDIFPSNFTESAKIRFEVRALYDSRVEKIHGFQHFLVSDDFTSKWEMIIEHAKKVICDSVRETQMNIDG